MPQWEASRHDRRDPPGVVSTDNAGPIEGVEEILELLVLILWWPIFPLWDLLLDYPPGEARQQGGAVVLDIGPLGVPPLE